MREKLLSILVLSILVASILGGCAPASPTPSTLSTLTILSITKGNVFVMKAGTDNWIEAEVGMSLEAGDTIKTDDFSSAEITFFDGSTIELQAGTEIEVVSLAITDTGSTTITLMQTIGTTISRVTKLLDPASSYEVETPTGVAAVRGSSMLVEVFADGSTSVTNIAGEIWVIYDGGELQVPQGGVCIFRFGEIPRLILWESLGDIGGGEFNDIVTDLAIDKSDSSDPVDPNTDLTYTVQITNNGPSNSTGAAVLDILPSGVSFVSATDGGTYDSDSHTVSWTISTLAKDASTSVNVTVTVNESTTPSIITNVAIVDANESDYYSANDATTEDTIINTVNHPPLATDDAVITDEDNPVTVSAPGVLNNDSDPDVGDTLAVTAVNTSGTIGAVTVWNTDGSFTYDPNGQFEYLQTGGSTTDSFTYTVSDGNGGTDNATVTINITGVNDQTVAVNDSYITNEDTPVTAAAPGVLNNDSDPDVGDTLTVTAVNTSGTIGAVTVWNADGSFTYNPNGQFEYLQAGGSTTDSFIYTVSDGKGGTDTATVAINITGVNDPPVAVDDNATTPQDTAVTIDVLNNDSDIDGGTLTVVSATNGTNGSVTNNGSNVTYTPALGFNGTDTFTYTISDGNGGIDTATVTVNVTVIETLANINVQIDTGAHASIYIWDDNTDYWATDEDTGWSINGTNHVTPDTITVAAGHYYYVWIWAADVIYYVKNYPRDWTIIIISTPAGDYEAAYGYATAGSLYPVHFTIK